MNPPEPVDAITLEQVFVTDGFPVHTYVVPRDGQAEKDLRDGLSQANKIISIVGASKCGKTTLCDEYFGRNEGVSKIHITGDLLQYETSLWLEIWEQLTLFLETGDQPHERDIANILVANEMPVLIDDFHYIEPNVQKILCRQMKSYASKGVRFVILNTPHRGDDPVRNNVDLTGRFFSVDMGFWTREDLIKIGEKGFAKLKVKVVPWVLNQLAREAVGSPQLMQTLCLEAGRTVLNMDLPLEGQTISIGNFELDAVMKAAVRSYDRTTAFNYLQNGPAERGSQRSLYQMDDGDLLDVYEALVKTMATDPPFNSILLDDLKSRLHQICAEKELPNIKQALNQVRKLFKDGDHPMEWDEGKRTLAIVDPHFYFYLRCKARGI